MISLVVLHVNNALPHTNTLPFEYARCWHIVNSFLCKLQLLLHPGNDSQLNYIQEILGAIQLISAWLSELTAILRASIG